MKKLIDSLRQMNTMSSMDSSMKKAVDLASQFYGVDPELIQVCISPSAFYSWVCWVQIMVVDKRGVLIKSLAPEDNIVGEGKTVNDAVKELISAFDDCLQNKIEIIEKPYLH